MHDPANALADEFLSTQPLSWQGPQGLPAFDAVWQEQQRRLGPIPDSGTPFHSSITHSLQVQPPWSTAIMDVIARSP